MFVYLCLGTLGSGWLRVPDENKQNFKLKRLKQLAFVCVVVGRLVALPDRRCSEQSLGGLKMTASETSTAFCYGNMPPSHAQILIPAVKT